MQSIFTFDHDPPRVSSPWRSASAPSRAQEVLSSRLSDLGTLIDEIEAIQLETSDELAVDKLDAEPQEGPIEYKVHLLLRPRRTFFATSNMKYAAGSQHSKPFSTPPRATPERFTGSTSPLSHSSTTRQHRLEQLTTQLLWRLQQSSPFHAASADNIILPTFPETSGDLLEPRPPAKLLPGLEESNGALYEIGVSDDGTFVGLTREEMHESLNNLQAMAASLGCATEVLRMVKVGKAERIQDAQDADSKSASQRYETLWVAEAYIKPLLDNAQQSPFQDGGLLTGPEHNLDSTRRSSTPSHPTSSATAHEQVRVTLAGATMSGKSSLLGTLSISTLDNGRGKSRLSLLKHRHEIASGMTSSVTQELVGYQDTAQSTDDGTSTAITHVINYATTNVSSWSNIHTRSSTGRLAFISDSAGHPRYRRTTVRGLLGWAPHWTLLCVPASNSVDPSNAGLSTSQDGQPLFAGASAHISMAQLDLCLRLRLPLVVVITKLDAASKTTFRQILSTLLTSLKTAGRKPVMLANDNTAVNAADLARLSERDVTEAERVVQLIASEGDVIVPVVFTSAVNGTGIGKIHALLRHLPIHVAGTNAMPKSLPKDLQTTSIFHVDDVFKLSNTSVLRRAGELDSPSEGSILSGHLARGELHVGQEVLLGPFSAQIERSHDEGEDLPPSNPNDPFLTPRSFSDALARVTAPPVRIGTADSEWRRVRIVSIRNLRIPAKTLSADHVGTIGVVPVVGEGDQARMSIRRGMVLTDKLLDVAHTLTASFDIVDASSLVVGNRVVVYSASVRSSAKVVAVALRSRREEEELDQSWQNSGEVEEAAFAMDEEESIRTATSQTTYDKILVTLQLDSYREWVEVGAKLLVMPGGGPGIHAGDRGIKGLAGLEGFVGQVVETFG